MSDALASDDLVFIFYSFYSNIFNFHVNEAFIAHHVGFLSGQLAVRSQIFKHPHKDVPKYTAVALLSGNKQGNKQFISRACTMFFAIPQTIKLFIGAVELQHTPNHQHFEHKFKEKTQLVSCILFTFSCAKLFIRYF